MKHYMIGAAVALVFGTLLVLTGCGNDPQPKANTARSSTPSVGREYGETLHGAITQAHKARRTLEQSGQTLGHGDDSGE